jgi:hypothetical protein
MGEISVVKRRQAKNASEIDRERHRQGNPTPTDDQHKQTGCVDE